MGCGGSHVQQRQPDVLIQGTGVEPVHCYIETSVELLLMSSSAVRGAGAGATAAGSSITSVILYPLGEMTSVDGTRVNSPVRLTQGKPIKRKERNK